MAEETTLNNYFFNFSIKLGGVIESEHSLEDTIAQLENDLTEIYGERGFELTEFRLATDEELSVIEEVRETSPTIN